MMIEHANERHSYANEGNCLAFSNSIEFNLIELQQEIMQMKLNDLMMTELGLIESLDGQSGDVCK